MWHINAWGTKRDECKRNDHGIRILGTVIRDIVSMFIMYICQSVYVMKFKVTGSKCRFRTQRDKYNQAPSYLKDVIIPYHSK